VVDHVVDEHDHLAVDVGHVRLESVRGLAQMAVVAVLAGVDCAHRNGVASSSSSCAASRRAR